MVFFKGPSKVFCPLKVSFAATVALLLFYYVGVSGLMSCWFRSAHELNSQGEAESDDLWCCAFRNKCEMDE